VSRRDLTTKIGKKGFEKVGKKGFKNKKVVIKNQKPFVVIIAVVYNQMTPDLGL